MKNFKNYIKLDKKNIRGITLIALVITIIVLLILAGVSIAMLTGQNGILTQASNASIRSDNATVAEAIKLKLQDFKIEQETNQATQSGGLSYLQSEGVIDGTGLVNIQNLLNQTLKTGNGSNGKDVYVIKNNHLYYYDKNGAETDLGQLDNLDEVLEETDPNLFAIAPDGTIGLANHGQYYDEQEWTVEHVVIPSEIDGIKVKKISDDMFMSGYGYPNDKPGIIYESFRKIKSIVIPEGVEEIGDGAFLNCIGLEKVVLPNSLKNINDGAFAGCINLKEINIPDGVTSIGAYAFQFCVNLQNISIPDSVTTIGEMALYYCTGIQNISIPENVTEIKQMTFWGCVNLKTIKIPSTVTTIGEMTFFFCDRLENIEVDVNNPNYSSIEGSLFDKSGETLIQYALGKTDKSYIIPESVKTIKSYAFGSGGDMLIQDVKQMLEEDYGYTLEIEAKVSDLTEINIPETVTTIEGGAFAYLTTIPEITIPSSVTSMGKGAFAGWTSEQTIHIPTSDGSTPTGWDSEWNSGCQANID